MTVRDLLAEGIRILGESGVENNRNEAQWIFDILQELLDRIGDLFGILGNDDGEADTVDTAELFTPQNEIFNIFHRCVVEQLVEAVDENVGDVEIACVQTADEALQEGQGTCHLVILIFDQTDTAVNIVTQLGAIFNADQAADFIFNCFIDVVDELLGLTCALQTHN